MKLKTTWHPITSAPKDRRVLLWTDQSNWVEGQWDSYHGWTVDDGYGSWTYLYDEAPTHWAEAIDIEGP